MRKTCTPKNNKRRKTKNHFAWRTTTLDTVLKYQVIAITLNFDKPYFK